MLSPTACPRWAAGLDVLDGGVWPPIPAVPTGDESCGAPGAAVGTAGKVACAVAEPANPPAASAANHFLAMLRGPSACTRWGVSAPVHDPCELSWRRVTSSRSVAPAQLPLCSAPQWVVVTKEGESFLLLGEPVPQEASAVPLRPAMSKNSIVRFHIAEGSALDTQYSPGVRVGREQTGGGNAGGAKHNNSSEQASDTLPTSGEAHCCAAGNYTSLTLIQAAATRVLKYNLCGTCCTCVLGKRRHVM